MGLIDFELDIYDYLTFAILFLGAIAFFYVMVTLGGLPGKLAAKRNHPHADSVKLGGWIGLFTVFPWIHALIWAYHDSLTIDVRTFPKQTPDDPVSEPGGVSRASLEATPVINTPSEKQVSDDAPVKTSPEPGGAA